MRGVLIRDSKSFIHVVRRENSNVVGVVFFYAWDSYYSDVFLLNLRYSVNNGMRWITSRYNRIDRVWIVCISFFLLDNDPSFLWYMCFFEKSILFCTIVQVGMVGECVVERCVACRIFPWMINVSSYVAMRGSNRSLTKSKWVYGFTCYGKWNPYPSLLFSYRVVLVFAHDYTFQDRMSRLYQEDDCFKLTLHRHDVDIYPWGLHFAPTSEIFFHIGCGHG